MLSCFGKIERTQRKKKVFRERIFCIYNELNHLISKSIWSSWTECFLDFFFASTINQFRRAKTRRCIHLDPFLPRIHQITCAWFGQSIPVYLTENNEYFRIQHVSTSLINWIFDSFFDDFSPNQTVDSISIGTGIYSGFQLEQFNLCAFWFILWGFQITTNSTRIVIALQFGIKDWKFKNCFNYSTSLSQIAKMSQ